jgi:hypothetical protein
MAVIRVEKTKNYTVMSNYHLRDKKLSLEAKGLLSILLSEPKLADCTPEMLRAYVKDGENVESIITELADKGYIHLT